jgi:hypothetical protein
MLKTVLMLLAFICATAHAQAQSPESRLVHARAIAAVIWGMPAVNTDLMRQEMLTKTAE